MLLNQSRRSYTRSIFKCEGYILSATWLPNPEIIRATIEKLLMAFKDVIQTKLIGMRL